MWPWRKRDSYSYYKNHIKTQIKHLESLDKSKTFYEKHLKRLKIYIFILVTITIAIFSSCCKFSSVFIDSSKIYIAIFVIAVISFFVMIYYLMKNLLNCCRTRKITQIDAISTEMKKIVTKIKSEMSYNEASTLINEFNLVSISEKSTSQIENFETTDEKSVENDIPNSSVPTQIQLPQPLPRPDRSCFERTLDSFFGDSPNQRMALICSQCYHHNGLCIAENFYSFQYYCAYCNFHNMPPDISQIQNPTSLDKTTAQNAHNNGKLQELDFANRSSTKENGVNSNLVNGSSPLQNSLKSCILEKFLSLDENKAVLPTIQEDEAEMGEEPKNSAIEEQNDEESTKQNEEKCNQDIDKG